MADQVSQGAVLVLGDFEPANRVSQGAILILYNSATPVQASQAATLILARVRGRRDMTVLTSN